MRMKARELFIVIDLAEKIALTYFNGGKVLVCGNGGLAAEAEHLTAELMGKYGKDIFIPCVALTVPSSLITALSNDFSFDDVFAHQIRALGNRGDLLIAMTSSQSTNVMMAMAAGLHKHMEVVILCSTYSKVQDDYAIRVDGREVGEVQENIIRYLHRVAREAKELISGN